MSSVNTFGKKITLRNTGDPFNKFVSEHSLPVSGENCFFFREEVDEDSQLWIHMHGVRNRLRADVM